MSKVQYIFCSDPDNPNDIHPIFKPEALELIKLGAFVGLKPDVDANVLIWRSIIPNSRHQYPSDPRYIHNWSIYNHYSDIQQYYPLINDLTIPSIFVNSLDDELIAKLKILGWEKTFVKNRSKSLWCISDTASVWPNTPFSKMKEMFEKLYGQSEVYCLRKFTKIEHEERYWVMNNKVFNREGKIPDIVVEAEKRLRTLGGKYYTIDATEELIIEVNPGESSDRHGVNSPELFASWLYESFCE